MQRFELISNLVDIYFDLKPGEYRGTIARIPKVFVQGQISGK